MWQRFTERARKVVFFAQEEAQKFGEGYVSTEHLLLGLVREPDNVAVRALEALGVDPNRVRIEVEKQLPRGDARPSQDMTLTPRAKRVVDLSYDEARSLNNNYIGTEHLLLGLIREGDGLAGRVLEKMGVELENARREVERIQSEEGAGNARPAAPRKPFAPPPDPWGSFDEAVKTAVDVAEAESQSRGQVYLTPEHLLLGLLANPENAASRTLSTLGIDLDRLREETAGRCRQASASHQQETHLSPASVKVFTFSYEEQRRCRASIVGVEHLLIGILREPDGVAGRTLDAFGIEEERLRETIKGLSAEGS